MGFCVIGFDAQSFIEMGNGFLVVALVKEKAAEVVMRLNKIAVDSQGFRIMENGFPIVVLPVENGSEVGMCL